MIIFILQKQTFNDLMDRDGILSRTQNSILKCYFARDLMILFKAVQKTENRALTFKNTEFLKCMLGMIFTIFYLASIPKQPEWFKF